jgi:hypothetical protein
MGKHAHAATLLTQDLQRLPFEPHGWDNFAARLAHTLHGPVILGTVHLPSGAPVRIDHVMVSDKSMADYRAYYYGISPWKKWTDTAPMGAVAAGTDINPLPPCLYENTAFYADFLRPNGMHHGISARVRRDGDHATDLAVLRARALGPIDADEQRLVRYLMPHTRRALRVQRLLGATHIAGDLLSRSVGVVLADRDGKVLYTNAPAHSRLSDGDGLTVQRGAVLPSYAPARPQMRALLRRAVDGAGSLLLRTGGDILLPRPGRPALRVTIVATPPTGDAYGALAPAALLLLREAAAKPVFRALG